MTFSTLKPGAKRTCKNRSCRNKFVPTERHPFAIACCTGCEIILGKQLIEKARAARAKAARKKEKEERAEVKQKLEAHKPLEYHLKKTEAVCNEYVRARDPDVCISCGVTYSTAWQAGHYISVGANRTLRYHEDNIHKQCIHCNMFKGSNALEYRPRLIEKIGIERVEWLESWHSPVKMTREAAEEIAEMYKGKLKALQGASQ
jgi:hypothetical protein